MDRQTDGQTERETDTERDRQKEGKEKKLTLPHGSSSNSWGGLHYDSFLLVSQAQRRYRSLG